MEAPHNAVAEGVELALLVLMDLIQVLVQAVTERHLLLLVLP
jgi:hypothetical protein